MSVLDICTNTLQACCVNRTGNQIVGKRAKRDERGDWEDWASEEMSEAASEVTEKVRENEPTSASMHVAARTARSREVGNQINRASR
jgi:hypothetical protein